MAFKYACNVSYFNAIQLASRQALNQHQMQ